MDDEWMPMKAMEMEHCLPPEEIAERLTQMRRSKHEINNTDYTYKPKELVEDYSEDSADEGAKPPHNIPDCLKDTAPGTQITRAQLIIDQQQCVHDSKVKAFLVQGTLSVHAVKLLPKNLCTCPAKNECYHILASKLSCAFILTQAAAFSPSLCPNCIVCMRPVILRTRVSVKKNCVLYIYVYVRAL